MEEGKCVQASAYVPSDNFTEYHVKEDADVMFKVNITLWVFRGGQINGQTSLAGFFFLLTSSACDLVKSCYENV